MRSALIFILTLGVIFGGFGLYLWLQPPAPKTQTKSFATITKAQRSSTTQSLHGIGSGDNPWIKRFENGELASQFRGERYDPQKDGTVYVKKPQAEFFSRDGQRRVLLEGATGIVHVPPGPDGQQDQLQGSGGVAMQPPTWGTLQDVVISMYEPADAAEPTLVGKMNNAAFDND
jgi:hypothetical protein